MKLLFLVLLCSHCCTGYPVVEDDNLIENGTSIEFWLDASNETSSNDSSPLDMHGFFNKVVEKIKGKMKDVSNKVKDEIKDCKDILKAFSFADDNLIENGTSIEYSFDAPNETSSNDSSPLDMHGFGKKVVNKVKDGIKTAKDGLNKVKDKMKDGYNKLKDKINNFKDKIGSKGGSGGGSGDGYYRDKYDRDYNRDKYDRDYNRDKYDRDYNRDKYDRDYYHKDRKYSGGGGVSDPNALWILGAFGILILVSLVVGVIYYNCKK